MTGPPTDNSEMQSSKFQGTTSQGTTTRKYFGTGPTPKSNIICDIANSFCLFPDIKHVMRYLKEVMLISNHFLCGSSL